MAIEQAFYAPDIGIELDRRDLADAAIYRIFEDELGFEIRDATQTIRATLATPEQAGKLDIAAGQPLTFIERTTFDTDARPLEFLRAAD